ncbi:hypothetical protein AAD018_005445 [Aestuariibius insulae]|uniref:hypothetical protein n=1 Tax=Aestuariibius insulae TaxID=2058287 RepID=UPI00345EDE1F
MIRSLMTLLLLGFLAACDPAADVTRASQGADSIDLPPGTAPAFGQMARRCGVDVTRGAEKVGRFPDTRQGVTLYDSNPQSTQMRPFFLTGFADNCPRQFMAALVTTGTPGGHEFVRYEATPASVAYSPTDTAYERIKRATCGAGKGKPCGNRLSRLEKQMAFFIAYQRFGTNESWAEFLVHNRNLIAASLEN